MKITTAEEMREIDRLTTARFGVQSITLMENAGVRGRPVHPRALSPCQPDCRNLRQR